MVEKDSYCRRVFLSPPHIGEDEQKFAQEAFESNYIAPLGPMVDAFEHEFTAYTGIKHCVALSSGTAAMHLALRHLGVEPGDEVFASTLTFIGSVTPVTFLGATPVLIDCDRETWNMDTDLMEAALADAERNGRLPKAVVPTDLYGQCCNYGRIFEVCRRYDLPVVVDAAEQGPNHPPGTWQRIDYRRSPDRVRARCASNAHALSVDLALKLAEQMDLLPAEVWIYAISVAPGGCGEAVSPAVHQTIQFLTQRILSDIKKWRQRREEGGA